MTTPSQAEKGRAFRALHERDQAFIIPNPWDVGSARMLASLGFEALASTSAGYAFSVGLLDNHVGRDAMLRHVSELAAATDLPVSADLENAFGDSPEVVADTFTRAAATGLVGGSIEDSTGRANEPIYEFSFAVERVKAAVATIRALPFTFTLTARAENFLNGRADLDDTIERLQAYERAGADVLFAPALPTLDAVRTVCSSVTRPVNFMVGIPGKSFSVAELAAAGVRRVSLATSLYRAAMTGLIEAAREVRESGTFAYLDSMVTSAEFAGYLKKPAA